MQLYALLATIQSRFINSLSYNKDSVVESEDGQDLVEDGEHGGVGVTAETVLPLPRQVTVPEGVNDNFVSIFFFQI